jgi:hypothetical protein
MINHGVQLPEISEISAKGCRLASLDFRKALESFQLNWINSIDYIPVNVLLTWWFIHTSSVNPSFFKVHNVHNFPKTDEWLRRVFSILEI